MRWKDSPSGLILATVIATTHGLLWLTFFLGMIFVVPGYERRFRDFDMQLPLVSIRVLEISHLVIAYFYLLPPLIVTLILLDGAIFLFCRRLRVGRLWSALWALVMFLAPAAALSWLWLGIYLPDAHLMQDLSK
jgi:type II secretory pathway component PulF